MGLNLAVKFILLIGVFSLTSCKELTKTTTTVVPSSSSPSVNPNAPSKWPTSSFPLTVKISSSFSAGEQSLIESMGTQWITAGNNELNFFDMTQTTANLNYTNLDSFYDSEMGVYKSTTWFSSVSAFALAITQFYGYRQNAGTSSEYIQLVHSDVIVNYKNYSFTTDLSSGYDLPSVILHELGHFLGLYHTTDYSQSSVMFPSILSRTSERSTYTYDKQSIASKYSINSSVLAFSGGGGNHALTAGRSPSSSALKAKVPEMIRGRMELRTDDYCYHYIEDKLVSKHKKKSNKELRSSKLAKKLWTRLKAF
jgi:hypothetical protein